MSKYLTISTSEIQPLPDLSNQIPENLHGNGYGFKPLPISGGSLGFKPLGPSGGGFGLSKAVSKSMFIPLPEAGGGLSYVPETKSKDFSDIGKRIFNELHLKVIKI